MLSNSLRLGFLAAALDFAFAQLLPDSQALTLNELEHLYLDNVPGGFKAAITPCTNYFYPSTGQSNNTLGRQTSSQWIRVAFHDMVTADAAAGTGGIDASIGFETLRPENIGSAMNDTLTWFSFYTNAKTSMADLLALGTAMATGSCGGPQIPLRVGRVDAAAAGPSGVPQPQTDINTTLSMFSGAGFDQQDSIGLTACGHTLGGVHHSNFPDVVPASAVGPNNSGGRETFDETVSNFDVDVAQDYVQATGSRGGPFVTTTNVTVQSDLRLYTSDHNLTMQGLAQSSETFRNTCTTLLSRMIDTVPSTVSLSSPIDPTIVGHANISLAIDLAGDLTLSGYFRYIETTGAASAPDSMTVTVIARNGSLTQISTEASTDSTDMGTGIYGPTFQYPFSVAIPGSVGLSGVQVGGVTYPLTDALFVVPTLSSISPSPDSFTAADPAQVFSFNITAALLTSSPPSNLQGTISLPVPQEGTISPKIDSSTTVQLDLIGTAGPFALYSVGTTQSITPLQLRASSIDVVDSNGASTQFFKLFSILQFF